MLASNSRLNFQDSVATISLHIAKCTLSRRQTRMDAIHTQGPSPHHPAELLARNHPLDRKIKITKTYQLQRNDREIPRPQCQV